MSRSLLRRDDKESVGTTKSVLGDKECFGDDEKSILVICVTRSLLRAEQVPPASGRQRKHWDDKECFGDDEKSIPVIYDEIPPAR